MNTGRRKEKKERKKREGCSRKGPYTAEKGGKKFPCRGSGSARGKEKVKWGERKRGKNGEGGRSQLTCPSGTVRKNG